MIGYWGDFTFEVNDRIIQYPEKLSRTASGRYATHYTSNGNRPYKEFLGAEHGKASFTMRFNWHFCDVRKMLDELVICVNEGKAGTLVIGTKPLGYDMWVCTGIEEQWTDIMSDGFVAAAEVRVTLEEYGN